MSYKDEILRGMNLLAEQPNVLFLGQGVRYQQASSRDCRATGVASL